MTVLDKIKPATAPGRAATTRRNRFARELAETLKLAVPMALTQLGQIAMMATDLAFIGRLGNNGVAAAALAGTVYFVGFTVGVGVGSAVGAPAPQAFGPPQPPAGPAPATHR